MPVKLFAAARARSLPVLLFYPFLDSVVLHELQVFDDLFMMPDTVHLVDFGKIFQALAREFRTSEAPGHLFLRGAAAETVAAVATGGVDMVGKASIAANFPDGDLVSLGHLL